MLNCVLMYVVSFVCITSLLNVGGGLGRIAVKEPAVMLPPGPTPPFAKPPGPVLSLAPDEKSGALTPWHRSQAQGNGTQKTWHTSRTQPHTAYIATSPPKTPSLCRNANRPSSHISQYAKPRTLLHYGIPFHPRNAPWSPHAPLHCHTVM